MDNAPPGERVLALINRFLQKAGDAPASTAAGDIPEKEKDAVSDNADVKGDKFGEQTKEQAPLSLEPQMFVEGPRTRTSGEMADIILRALQAIDGCPKRGFEITVYGSNPWNAMLRITPAAGLTPVAAPLWRERIRVLVPLLREQYEVMDP